MFLAPGMNPEVRASSYETRVQMASSQDEDDTIVTTVHWKVSTIYTTDSLRCRKYSSTGALVDKYLGSTVYVTSCIEPLVRTGFRCCWD